MLFEYVVLSWEVGSCANGLEKCCTDITDCKLHEDSTVQQYNMPPIYLDHVCGYSPA